jgi:protein-disulfide isomerase
VLEKYPKEVMVVIINFPLPNHRFARKAALVALAAGNQGKFWEMHQKLFEHFRELNDARMDDLAREIGLNLDQFHQDLNDKATASKIDRDLKVASQANVNSTPTVLINGKVVHQRNMEAFQQVIEAELKKKILPN